MTTSGRSGCWKLGLGSALASGNGGNINIDTELLVAVPSEDSNITADAFEGRGGNINITAFGIFGIQPREQQSPSSDITASSELGIDGIVEVNTPDVDPNSGLVALPEEVVDVTGLIAQGCSGGGESVASSEFIVTGRGGLPPNPGDTLSTEAVLADWATLKPEVENRSGATPSTNPTRVSAPTAIVEAQGWAIGSKGEVILIASAPTVTPYIPWLPPRSCHN